LLLRQRRAHSRDSLEKYRLELDAGRRRQRRSRPLGAVLGQLDDPDRHGEFLVVQARGGGLVGNRPDIFQNLNRELGAGKELYRLRTGDDSVLLDVSGPKEGQVIGLFMGLGGIRQRRCHLS